MNLDEKDSRILEALMADGRASIRMVARRTSLTAPTVSARLARMMKSGMIKRFVPLLDPDSLGSRVVVFVTMKAAPSAVEALAERFATLREVEGVYVTTGANNVTLKIALTDVQELQQFLKERVMQDGVEISTSQIAIEVLKDEPPSLAARALEMRLTCEHCGGDVSSNRPYNIVGGGIHYYFCCKTCRKAYIEEHASRLSKLTSGSESV